VCGSSDLPNIRFPFGYNVLDRPHPVVCLGFRGSAKEVAIVIALHHYALGIRFAATDGKALPFLVRLADELKQQPLLPTAGLPLSRRETAEPWCRGEFERAWFGEDVTARPAARMRLHALPR
jgi:hypothetical protein